jgi:probable HAF family extracellular repeat protein
MKSRLFSTAPTAALLAALTVPMLCCGGGVTQSSDPPPDPPSVQNLVLSPPPYTVKPLGKLSGEVSSYPLFIASNGWVAGQATLATGALHAIFWQGERIIDIGAPGLGGPNSFGFGVDSAGQVAGLAETGAQDSNGEDFCGFGTFHTCLPFLWQSGVMAPLPIPPGGNNGQAYNLNELGQAVGVAENGVQDADCTSVSAFPPPGLSSPPPQYFDFEAVIWGPISGQIQELPPLPGDTVGFALGVNRAGDVAGSSGSCADTVLDPFQGGPHAVLWQNGSPINLGTLGATSDFATNAAAAVNDQGWVTGGSTLVDNATLHTFLCTQPGPNCMQDLGTIAGDAISFPTAINNKGQIVGESCDANFNCRAYLWQNNVMTDLNALIPSDSPLYLLIAQGINDSGEIDGQALIKGTNELVGFVAMPTRPTNSAASEIGPSSSQAVTKPMSLPASIRAMLRRRLPSAAPRPR